MDAWSWERENLRVESAGPGERAPLTTALCKRGELHNQVPERKPFEMRMPPATVIGSAARQRGMMW